MTDYVLDHFETRNRLAEQVIAHYTASHAATDVAIGLIGMFVPFGGTGAMIVSLAAQAPLVYQPMVKDLAKIYSAPADDFTRKVVNKATILDAAGDIGSQLVRDSLVSEFGQEFLLEILRELLPELGMGAVLGVIPIIGGIVAAGLDATLAATLTWRVGITIALYFFNGHEWPGGSKKRAYDIAKGKTGTPSPVTNRPGIIDEDLLKKDPAMWEYNVKGIVQIIRSMQRINPSLPNSEIRSYLKENGYVEEVVEEALKNRRSEILRSTEEAVPKSLEVFFSYAHEDKKMRLELEKYLSNLKRQGSISSWHDGEIGAGDEWEQEIDRHLSQANIILLLVSQDFIASNYCYEIEMRQALERHRKGEACVVPIILRPADWEVTPFGNLQALPTGGEPIALWPNRDEAFLNVARGIQKVVDRLARNNILE